MIYNAIILFLILVLPTNANQNIEVDFESPLELISPAIDDLEKSNFPMASNIESLIALQSPVRSQGKRGVCTMFTTVGLIEHQLIKTGLAKKDEIDLSEEWMEYVMMSRKTTEGSNTSRNFREVLKHGLVNEITWPYIGMKWTSLEENPESKIWCEHLIELPDKLASCLLGHRDPSLLRLKEKFLKQRDSQFLLIRNKARAFRDDTLVNLIPYQKSYKLDNLSTVKDNLVNGRPLIMGLKLFYGSWNSKKTETFDIQTRDKSKWYKGIVTYPEVNSRDRRISGVEGGGHSLIIVGYDDEKIIRSKMLMEDGTWKEFTYKGVYYFKNSWGIKGSGKRFEYNGITYPGFGMITQKYAHEFGTFYSWK